MITFTPGMQDGARDTVGRIGKPRPIGNRPLRTVYNRTGAIDNRPQDTILMPHSF
jgi:hypothetical protein